MTALNYAQQYSQALANAYGSSLYSGALWSTENSTKYKVIDAKTIQIPILSVGGRSNGDRDTIGSFTRNFDNAWETKTLSNHRTWQTLVHPKDIDETNQVASITNITQTMNEQEKFPEMDAYIFSNIFTLRNAQSEITALSTALTASTVLDQFDAMMDAMDEARVPLAGRVLYCDTYHKTLIDNAIVVQRLNGDKKVARDVSRLEDVDIQSVPTDLFKTAYTFGDSGYAVADGAGQINMMLLHPSSILPIASYSFAQLGEPTAMSQGKWVYFEESFEDVFILNKRVDAIQIAYTAGTSSES